MDNAQWTQEFGVAKSMAEIACSRPQTQVERKVRPQKDQAINCPRCNSTNTKFCYYNNYSLTQPRYFCKTCRRYWTEGGTLRNVPVGGGSRKNKRSSSSSPSVTMIPSSHKLPDLNPPTISPFTSQNLKNQHDLNLGFQAGPHGPQFLENSSSSTDPLSALDFSRNGIAARGLSSFLPSIPPKTLENDALFASGFQFQEFKSALLFPLEGNSPQENVNGNLMFATRRNSSEQGDGDKGQENSNGFWNGMLGGGSW